MGIYPFRPSIWIVLDNQPSVASLARWWTDISLVSLFQSKCTIVLLDKLNGENGPLPLFNQKKKKISNLPLLWKYIGIYHFFKTWVCHETWVPKTRVLWKKKYFKFARKFFMVLKYHGKLNFVKLEYPKSGRSLHISETVVNCNIVCKKMLFGHFCPN